MHPADGVILAIIAVSALFGVFRGFVREAFALAGWVVAYAVAQVFHVPLEPLLTDHVATPSLRLIAAWGGLFVVTLLLVSLAGYMVRSLLEAAGVTAVDRGLGGLFGLIRGGILVLAALVMMAPFVNRDDWWQQARLPGMFMQFEQPGRALQQNLMKVARKATSETPAPRDQGATADGQP